MDVLSQILALMRIDGSVMAEIDCAGDWGIDLETGDGIPFHYVIAGKCWLNDGDKVTPLESGDLVAAAHWPFHALASSPDQPLIPIARWIADNGLPAWTGGTLDRPLVIKVGDRGDRVRILSGVFTLKGSGAAMLLQQLPPILHMKAQVEGLELQLGTALDFVRQESDERRPGYVAVAGRLMDLLFIQILRAAIRQPNVHVGLLAGLADDRLARALAVIHEDAARRWTVADLAIEACLSRTTFAERFRQTIGLSPIQYVNRWRMTVAEDLLVQPGITIDAARKRLGFVSSFAFARAFRAHSGVTPREFRQHGRNPLAAAGGTADRSSKRKDSNPS